MRNQTATMAAPMRPAMMPSRRYLDRESMRTLLSIEWDRGPNLLLFVYHRVEVTASGRDAIQCPPRANAGGYGGRHALVRSTSSPRAPPRSGASAWPPIPRDGGRSPPRLRRGRLARRRRPALRGALRLVGFAPEGMPATAPALPVRFGVPMRGSAR